jgi:membrane protein YqaA with SNARE-associated domain
MWFHAAPPTLTVPSGWVVRTPFHRSVTVMALGRSTRQCLSVVDVVATITSVQ